MYINENHLEMILDTETESKSAPKEQNTPDAIEECIVDKDE